MPFTAQCLCGGIAFAIEGDLQPIQICHCVQCRKAQGSAFAAVIPVPASAFRFVRGENLLSSFESSPGKQRLFCSCCGSPVLSRRLSLPEVVRVRVGLINEPLQVGIAWHAYTESKANWWPIADEAPQYTGAYVNPGA
jgi:hypothetical protein